MSKQIRQATMELVRDQFRIKLNRHIEIRKNTNANRDLTSFTLEELAIMGIYLALDEIAMSGIDLKGIVATTEV